MPSKTYPVVETFGPTIQGEGPLAGCPTYFVRLGLCDYRCSWCDSMYAVEPAEVKEHADQLSAAQIVERVRKLPPGPEWVTLSGGNPAFHELDNVVSGFAEHRIRVSVETQGSLWRDWLGRVQMLVVSPKPPSSGMVSDKHAAQTERFMHMADRVNHADRRALKIVVFDDDDYEWAREFLAHHRWRSFISVGTPIPDDDPVPKILDRYRWLCERVAGDTLLQHVRVLPQLHVLAWGQVRGVYAVALVLTDAYHDVVETLVRGEWYEGVEATPRRAAQAMLEMTSGYGVDVSALFTTFEKDGYDEMILVKDIPFVSLCEHHLLPFTGTAAIGYIPDHRIVGLSKLARVVDAYARRLQVQERLTVQIADALDKHLAPVGSIVVVEAAHSCMSCRGVRVSGTSAVTSSVRGAIRDKPEARAEAMALLAGGDR